MTKREVVRPCCNTRFRPTCPGIFPLPKKHLRSSSAHYGDIDVGEEMGNHFLRLGATIGFFEQIGPDHVQDVFGVVWDRHIDRDIGNVEGQVLPEPTLAGYTFPDPTDPRYFADIPEKLEKYPDRFRVFELGFSLYERAWTMRGMEPMLMDFVENPEFAHELLDRICDYNIAHITKALEYDIDAVYFGDDWGSQHGLIMGTSLVEEVHRAAPEAHVRCGARGRQVRLHPLLRRCRRALRSAYRYRPQLFQSLPARSNGCL
jgi:uroporphyrinogen decarboxylase